MGVKWVKESGKLLRGPQGKSLDKERVVREPGLYLMCHVHPFGHNPFLLFPSPFSLLQQILLSGLCVLGIVKKKSQARVLASWSLLLVNWKET